MAPYVVNSPENASVVDSVLAVKIDDNVSGLVTVVQP